MYNAYIFLYNTCVVFVSFLHLIVRLFTPYSDKFVVIINLSLFIFVTIPWFLFGEFFKPILMSIYLFLKNFFKNYTTLQICTDFFLNFVKTFLHTLYNILHKLYLYVFKKFIDFLFFDLYRNRALISNTIHIFLINTIRILLVYFFLYQGIWNYIFNIFFYNFNESFAWWDFSTWVGVLYILITFLNVDHLIMFFYLLFVDTGLWEVLCNTRDENILLLGPKWINLYCKYKLDDVNFCFFRYIVDTCVYKLYTLNLNNFFFEFNDTPVFFYFGFLFFSTVIVSWFFFSYLGLYGIFTLNVLTLFFFWVSLLLSAKSILILNKSYIIKICSWVFLSINLKVDYYFLIDTISFSFILLTTTIAFFVYIYAFSYFRYEPLVDRFLLFLLSFVISMLFLVASGNTVMLFLGWELIGFTSFCLINFWTTKAATLKSAFKAFTFNKFSDFFMFMFLVSTFTTFYTFDILSLNQQIYKYEYSSMYLFGTPVNLLEFISLMIIGAAFIKSAQLGGHAWLPDSMEAPVPASSLIHSATLVSAGIYLILRFNFIFDVTQYSKFIIPVVGSLTAAYGGVCAAAQSDIKKTLAYSTISHCGFLMVLCSTEMNEFTILYLYVHGFFKAGVFMCVGNVLRISKGYQDTRRMGGLLKYLPFEYFCAFIGLFNLAGLPFTFGFFIKHLLLISLDTHMYIYTFVIFNSLVGAFAGLFYSFRIINYTFGDFKKGGKSLYLTLNRVNYNSKYYTNSSIAATMSIFFLFVFSYIIIYYMCFYFLSGSFLFCDYMNTTLLSNYYATISAFNGFLLNFSYINTTVVFIFLALTISKYRKTPRFYLLLQTLLFLFLFFVFIFIFLNLI